MRSRTPRAVLSVVLVLVLLLLGELLVSSYRDQLRKAEIGTRNVALLLQTQLYETLRRTEADVALLAAELPREALDAAAAPRFKDDIGRRLAARMVNVERMDGLHVTDGEGNILYSSLREWPHFNVSIRGYFKELRENPQRDLVYSHVVRSGLTGREVLVVARAIRDGNRRLLGTVLSPLDLASYKEQFAELDAGENGFVALRRSDHSLIVGWPDSPANPPDIPSGHPFRGVLEEGVLAKEVAGVPGFIVSIARVPEYPFYFAVGVDRASVLRGWYAQVILVAAVALVASTLVGVLVTRLGRMRRREEVILSDLAQREAQFRELVELVPVGVARFDTAGRCVFVNARCAAIAGRLREELVGGDWSEVVHPDDWPVVQAVWRSAAGDGRVQSREFRLIRRDGQPVFVIAEIGAERQQDGTVNGYVVAQTDVSLLKQVERELLQATQQAEQASQAKTRFLAAASHDLRQPIQAINLFKDALCRTGLNNEQETIAGFLSLSVNALSDLLYSLLDISKLDAGLIRPQLRPVEVETLFEMVDEEFSSIAQQKQLRFKFYYPFNSPVLETDPALLQTVLRNLIDNAFKYTRSGGVLIGARRRGARCVIQVWDTGIGIDPGLGERVFEECFQVDNASQDRSKGLGIGLSIARRMARLLGGDVRYRSRLGRGSVFEIIVPLSTRQVQPARTSDEVPGSGSRDNPGISGARVVVIEDDPVVAKSIELSLQAVGMIVQHFASAERALSSPVLSGADFYISDLVLPGMNGIDLLDTIQQRAEAPLKAVLITGETSPERSMMLKKSGWPILFKPAGLSSLLGKMEEISRSR